MRVKVKATDLLSACNEAKPYTKARGLAVDTAIVLRRDAGGPLRVSAGFLHRVTTAIDCEAEAPFAAAVDARTLIATLKTLDGDVALSVEPGKLHLNTATLPSIAGDFPKDMPAAKTLGAANAADTRVPDMTLPRAAVPLFRRALKGITGLAVVGPRLCVVRGASTHWFTLNDVPFPPWRQVVPQHYTHTARFDAASLRLSVALLLGDKSTWRFAESACEVSADGCAERIELRAFVVPFSIAMNPAYVADALAHGSSTTTTIEMRMNGELDPVVFVVEGSDAIHIVMPMRSRP